MDDAQITTNISTPCKNGDWSTFQDLVNNGANINKLGDLGNSGLHFASQGIFLFQNHIFCIVRVLVP